MAQASPGSESRHAISTFRRCPSQNDLFAVSCHRGLLARGLTTRHLGAETTSGCTTSQLRRCPLPSPGLWVRGGMTANMDDQIEDLAGTVTDESTVLAPRGGGGRVSGSSPP